MALTANETSEALADFSVVEQAPRLLRFFSPQGLPLLTHGTLRVTPPNEFNDPFEFYTATPKILPTVDQMRGWLMAKNSFLRHAYEINHRTGYEEWVEKVALKESQHWPSSLRSMSVGYAEAISRAYGVCCFMELNHEEVASPEIVHFWDRYADNHRGFAVAFNTGTGLLESIRRAKFLFSVNYHSETSRPVVAPGELTTDDAAMLKYLRNIAAQKFDTWRAEREWRLIASLSDNPKNPVLRQVKGDKILYFLDLWRYVPPEHQGKEIVAVYLGHRASGDLTQNVVTACSQSRLAHVSVFRAKPSDHDYSFSYERLK